MSQSESNNFAAARQAQLATMDTHPDYTADWHDYRKRRLVFWVLFLGLVPGVIILFAVIGMPISAVTGIDRLYFFYWIAGLWMLMLVVARFRSSWFKCPRCHNLFFVKHFHRLPFISKCLHCGLPKWASSDTARPLPPQ